MRTFESGRSTGGVAMRSGWAVGDLNGLPEMAILGNVVFQVLPTMRATTFVNLAPASTFCGGCWIDVNSLTPIVPDYISATVSRVPLPGAIWFMVSAIGLLLGMRCVPDYRLF